MDSYNEFASVYDMFMDNVPYEEWSRYLIGKLKEAGIEDGIILELGCGTGSMTELLSEAGYDMIGIDNSEEMLGIAIEKRDESGHDILYLNQDMREFELYGTVRAVVSVCDSLNYITDKEELLKVFKLVNNYLDIGGMFIFDMNTIDKYKRMGDGIIAENRDNGSFIWENWFDESENINEYDITLYIEDSDGKYDRYEETHYQKGYTVSEIRELIEQAGMQFIGAVEAFNDNEITHETERMYIMAKEIKKAGIYKDERLYSKSNGSR